MIVHRDVRPVRCHCFVTTVAAFFLSIAPLAAAEVGGLTEEEIHNGWIALFDGETFFGWQKAVDADFRIEDGAIVVDNGEVGLLRTTTQFSCYRLRLEFQCDENTNSGIFLHTSPRPQQPGVDCYELNIAPADNPFPTGSLVAQHAYTSAGHTPEWRQFDVTVLHDKITVRLDDQVLYEFDVAHFLGRGYIGLQHNQGRVAFRNIRLLPLNTEPLLAGEGLAGWKEYPEMDSKFTVPEPGVLHVLGGRGQLETKDSYGDFVLQLQCKTNAPGLNSGVFFRCIPGSQMDGYESQIHNGMKNNDPTQPEDFGTGGIFRRQAARRVVASDQTWFSKTIVAEGPHFAVWVNGYQVTDWTDTRKPDPNPRRGLRLEPGTIMLQGHDPTTDILFRGLRISEMQPRQRL